MKKIVPIWNPKTLQPFKTHQTLCLTNPSHRPIRSPSKRKLPGKSSCRYLHGSNSDVYKRRFMTNMTWKPRLSCKWRPTRDDFPIAILSSSTSGSTSIYFTAPHITQLTSFYRAWFLGQPCPPSRSLVATPRSSRIETKLRRASSATDCGSANQIVEPIRRAKSVIQARSKSAIQVGDPSLVGFSLVSRLFLVYWFSSPFSGSNIAQEGHTASALNTSRLNLVTLLTQHVNMCCK